MKQSRLGAEHMISIPKEHLAQPERRRALPQARRQRADLLEVAAEARRPGGSDSKRLRTLAKENVKLNVYSGSSRTGGGGVAGMVWRVLRSDRLSEPYRHRERCRVDLIGPWRGPED